MERAHRPTAPLVLALALAAGCAHGAFGSRTPSRVAQRFMAEAAQIRSVPYEEDYVDARLVYQALPLGTRERTDLRRKLLEYLIGPIARLDVARSRKDVAYLGNTEEPERALESFREAIEVLIAPSELWSTGALRLSADERALLGGAARAIVDLFSPRGNESAVATGLFVLHGLDPAERAWTARLDQLFSWLDGGAQLALGGGPRGSLQTITEVLETVAAAWPSPPVVERLTRLAVDRQQRLAGALRRPLSTGARSALSELLIDSEALQAMAVSLAGLHLRCGQLQGAIAATTRLANRPGDDPELRQLLGKVAGAGGADDYLALARRFLPRIEPFAGTSNDRLDPVAAGEVLRLGLERHATSADLLQLAAQVARATQRPYLAMRHLEEAQAALIGRRAASSQGMIQAEHDLVALSFARMQQLAEDPRTLEPAARSAQLLRQRFARVRRGPGGDRFKLRDGDIDFALARGYMDAGQLDQAEPLLSRARRDTEGVEVTLQIGKLLLKRGDSSRAVQVLHGALAAQREQAPREETLPFVESQSRLAQLLGDAHELTGNTAEAQRAWKLAVGGWERLRNALLARKMLDAAPEATLEVGRLFYHLGRRAAALQMLSEAIDQNEGRGQTYIDALVFLVPRGETEAALDVFRRILARPGREMNEYFKVYASLWITDLTRRSNKTPDPGAEAYLRSIDARRVQLRPRRDAAWYVPLARYALGRLTYAQLVPLATTPGRRAELYFYEAMRRLASGNSDDAHDLWNKVLETKMISFIEFEMAARYLRKGAPSQPRPETTTPGDGVSI